MALCGFISLPPSKSHSVSSSSPGSASVLQPHAPATRSIQATLDSSPPLQERGLHCSTPRQGQHLSDWVVPGTAASTPPAAFQAAWSSTIGWPHCQLVFLSSFPAGPTATQLPVDCRLWFRSRPDVGSLQARDLQRPFRLRASLLLVPSVNHEPASTHDTIQHHQHLDRARNWRLQSFCSRRQLSH